MSRLLTRRSLLGSAAAFAGSAALAQSSDPTENSTAIEADLSQEVRRNISSFRRLDWRPYFDSPRNGMILADIQSRALHFWSEDLSTYLLYPTSVPLSEDLTRRGRTTITRKVEGPGWRPTPDMRKRNPDWPDYVPPGPNNPLGTHALYLGWEYYRIHGTHDRRKIGRQSSNGCVGLYNEHVAQLYKLTKVGTQVLLL